MKDTPIPRKSIVFFNSLFLLQTTLMMVLKLYPRTVYPVWGLWGEGKCISDLF